MILYGADGLIRRDQARRLLADAAARLARPMPELPATNPRE